MATLFDSASLAMIPSGYKDDKLYSIKPTDGSGDFTFSRDGAGASPATRVNASGLIEKGRENLLTYSNTFINAVWIKSGASVTSGQSGYDGSSDAWALTTTATAGSHRVYHSSVNSSGIVTCSVYAKANGYSHLFIYANTPSGTDRGAYFDLLGGSVGTQTNKIVDATITSVGGGWYRCDVKQDNSLGIFELYVGDGENISFTGDGTSGILIQDAQVENGLVSTSYIETTTAPVSAGLLGDMPRLDYHNPDSPTPNSCPSLLLEPSRVNLLGHSEYFGDSNFLKDGVTATANYSTSPEGVQNAYSVVESAVLEDHRILWNTGFAGTGNANYSLSVYVKKIAGQPTRHIYWMCQEGANAIYAHFDMDNFSVNQQSDNGTGSIVDADIIPVGNDWYRLTLSGVISANTGTYYNQLYFETTPRTGFSAEIYTGNGTSGFELYGWQIESGSYPTSYIPTYGSASTRALDDCEKLSATDIIGQTEGTLFLDFVPQSKDFQIIYQVRTTGSSNVGQIDFRYQSGNLRALGSDGGVTQFAILGGDIVVGQRYKCAVRYAENDVAFYVNGSLAGTDTSASFSSSSLQQISFSENAATFYPQADVKQALLFKTGLTNAELAALTTI